MADAPPPPRRRRRRPRDPVSLFDEEEVAARLRKAVDTVAPKHSMDPHQSNPDLGWDAVTGERRNPFPDDDD